MLMETGLATTMSSPLEVSTNWRELPGTNTRISSGEYVVYHFLAKGLIRCTPEGHGLNNSNEMGYVFGNLANAQQYCRHKVEENPRIACTVYDSDRKGVDQVFSTQYLERTARSNSPPRQIFIGTLLLAVGVALVWIDAAHSWMLLVGFLVGARLAVSGVAKIVLALTGLRKSNTSSTKISV
jgi:hypothetical protein